ncbi:MAG TPA: LON peptidase substrate-binding domain-containing protein [Pyrinomonadaceae bacterium]|jgi:Lon protease-like protein|nr:LON peptidase substrate-binding domain-containing protein [Pyrinomonadaceae bacterium]
MTESLDKVRGVRELPIFPLGVVLFPGTPLPLHIFEPRYRQMLEDIRASGTNMFGISYFAATEAVTDEPPPGHVGCVAEVAEAQSLPDGRSNIITVGVVRYRLASYVERGDPYLVGRVSFFEDEVEDQTAVEGKARAVRDTFMRIARAVRTLNDDRTGLPDISQTEPEKLSFLVASAIEIDAEIKQELLEITSTSARLERLTEFLAGAVTAYEERARVHGVAKGNGHGGTKVNF